MMDVFMELTSENGVFALVGAFIGFVLSKFLTVVKIRKVNAEQEKLVVQTLGMKEKYKRQREAWNEKKTPQITALINVIPAKKTDVSPSYQFERLDNKSFFNVVVLVTNFGDKPVTLESVKFYGQEMFVDHGYGSNKPELEQIQKDLLDANEMVIRPDTCEEFKLSYNIGMRFNERMAIDVTIRARVGNHPSTEMKYSKPLVYIY
ncbi:hypothetical protein [Shewanella pneumatophori]|uniref:Uncharacterized protein n=1 Tax=Shewanella pneumatophori TaxID=314092 RepID=A0A9X1ZH59_9GAMM|nr:hypothetical protein [Shewanella pneumatophori]MCL1137728.1 hypothetical protein [Shewanella pneumatophori]